MSAITYTAKRDIEFDTATFVLPLLDLGNGAVDTSLVRGTGPATFTRASPAASRLSTGLWKLDVASGVARAHYLADLSYGGYLSEPAATQLITPSAAVRDMTNAAWVKTSMTAAKTSTGIDGVAAACSRLTATGANGTALFTLTAAASSRTYSFFVKRITGSGNIQITQDNGGTWTTVTVTSAFTLVQLNASVLNAVFGIRIVTSGDAIDVDCNQFEAGAFATTPIPAAGTRNADALTYPFTGNAAVSVGTLYAEVTTEWTGSANAALIGFSTNAAGAVLLAPSDTSISTRDGTSTFTKSGLLSTFTGVRKRASTFGGSTMSVTGDGAAVATGAFDGLVDSTLIGIGCDTTGGADSLAGTIKNARVHTTKSTDAVVSSMTSATKSVRAPGQVYSFEFDAEGLERELTIVRNEQKPMGGGAAEVLLQRLEKVVSVGSGIVLELNVDQWREFFSSVAAEESFILDALGTIAAPVNPQTVVLDSNRISEKRLNGILAYRFQFDVRL